MPEKKPDHPQVVFIGQFQNLAAGGISAAIGHTKDAFFILIVIHINALAVTFQEWKAEKGEAETLQRNHAHRKRVFLTR